ncbi:hypothetical protein H839_09333 [Parageobacillus genomosp. 1]|uniref:Uncharacterized protein n=1 Tax=Parageobacillus genomosp. 1 TaxID=1295642 RepID=A0ABC9VEI2_9BACL|nr:TasA family protein [Parageobacillus genomosp. 1]EZP76787.1 hypothetical protein H839_09333 [Parageobacillus genomosp. 1]
MNKVLVTNSILLLLMALLSANPIGYVNSSFTDQVVNEGNTLTSATVDIETVPASPNVLMQVNNMLPGDSVSANVTVRNTGTVPIVYRVFANSSPGTTPLWTFDDPTKTLQLKLTDMETGSVLYSGPLSGLTTANLPLAENASQTLQFQVTLPDTANEVFQNFSETVTFQFIATQLEGGAR